MTSFVLHIMALLFMTCDHLWATLSLNLDVLAWIGRLAFPIFAFMIVEGYFCTKDLKKYKKRLFVFALISEIPFNLFYSGILIYPFHQNVLWTFLIGLTCISYIDKIKKKENGLSKIILIILVITGSYLLALLTMVDYYGYGILTMLTFYFFNERNWTNRIAQLICMFLINAVMIKGLEIPITILSFTFNLRQQFFAIFSLLFIWGYNGEQGPYNKYIKYFYYLYYPVHMLVFYLFS